MHILAVLCHLPHEVVMVDAVPSGWVVYMSPLWCDECVGSVWGYKQIWKSQGFTRQKKNPRFNLVVQAHHAIGLGQVK